MPPNIFFSLNPAFSSSSSVTRCANPSSYAIFPRFPLGLTYFTIWGRLAPRVEMYGKCMSNAKIRSRIYLLSSVALSKRIKRDSFRFLNGLIIATCICDWKDLMRRSSTLIIQPPPNVRLSQVRVSSATLSVSKYRYDAVRFFCPDRFLLPEYHR